MNQYEGFDEFAGKKWVYPINMPVRGYQKSAVERALLKNFMIVLPTGFGKTFIAAVVMYNFYRWYPEGKLIFVAPTKPLVAQQIDECKKISGIPSSECIELTGSISREKRADLWKNKRVIFATPQVIENDLEHDILPATKVRCIVIDEAHRAQGGYAYVNIISRLNDLNRNKFRVLALSATPGTNIERVRQVILNLYIGDVMFRTEDSIDLADYTNKKESKAWVGTIKGEHLKFVEQFKAICEPCFKPLIQAGLTYGKGVDKVNKMTLRYAMEKIRQNECSSVPGVNKGRLSYLCCLGMSLAAKFELLTLYGIRVFYSSVMQTLNESRSVLKTELSTNIRFDMLLNAMKQMFGEEDIEPDINKPGKLEYTKGHPKLFMLQKLLIDHFNKHEGKVETRAIVFSHYRESVFDIVQTLKAYDPILKPCAFVGQGKGSKSNTHSGLSQKEQKQMISDFKAGIFNVLVATSVAEEGLDIGEVDIIVCYDCTSSPISTTQRRGRTGRKRSGNVHTLITEGYDEQKVQKAGSTRRKVESELFKRENYITHCYRDSPRMVPPHITPEFFPIHITPVDDAPVGPVRRKRQSKPAVTPKSKKGKVDLTDEKKSQEVTSTVDDCFLLDEKTDDEKPDGDREADVSLQSLPCDWDSDWDSS